MCSGPDSSCRCCRRSVQGRKPLSQAHAAAGHAQAMQRLQQAHSDKAAAMSRQVAAAGQVRFCVLSMYQCRLARQWQRLQQAHSDKAAAMSRQVAAAGQVGLSQVKKSLDISLGHKCSQPAVCASRRPAQRWSWTKKMGVPRNLSVPRWQRGLCAGVGSAQQGGGHRQGAQGRGRRDCT